jgi:Ca2+-binding EF-hand superfamily protein
MVAVGIICGGILCAVSTVAEAGGRTKQREKQHRAEEQASANMFKNMDTDGNETVSPAEFKAGYEKLSDDMKEKLARKYGGAKAAKSQDAFGKLDTDGGGSLSKEEMDWAHP